MELAHTSCPSAVSQTTAKDSSLRSRIQFSRPPDAAGELIFASCGSPYYLGVASTQRRSRTGEAAGRLGACSRTPEPSCSRNAAHTPLPQPDRHHSCPYPPLRCAGASPPGLRHRRVPLVRPPPTHGGGRPVVRPGAGRADGTGKSPRTPPGLPRPDLLRWDLSHCVSL